MVDSDEYYIIQDAATSDLAKHCYAVDRSNIFYHIAAFSRLESQDFCVNASCDLLILDGIMCTVYMLMWAVATYVSLGVVCVLDTLRDYVKTAKTIVSRWGQTPMSQMN